MRLRTENLSKTYRSRTDRSKVFYASKDVNIELEAGQTIALFGSSGGGKSTLGQMVSGLLKPTSGKIFYEEEEIKYPFKGEARRNIQILFQHPEISFNPALPIIKSLTEPYKLYNIEYSLDILIENVERYGLHEEHLYRKPSELSGGELQRAALSRLLVMKPKIIVLDEPTSMLDVITQAQMIGMLKDYQREENASYIFITHNRSLCEKVCDKIYDVKEGIVTLE